MKSIFGSPCKSLVPLVLAVVASSPVLADDDADGVPNEFDVCADTILGVQPTINATKNRFYATVDGTFVDGRGTISIVTIAEAGGCSGQQIIELANLGSSNEKYGLWELYLLDWAEFVGSSTNLDNDDDGDGVLNDVDFCPTTILGVKPTIGATKNRFYATLTGTFVDGRGTPSEFTIADTGGCSGQQIIELEGLSSSNERYGLWERNLMDWVTFVNGDDSSDTNPDEDGDGITDDVDVCPATILGVPPTVGVAENRFYTLTTGAFVDGLCRISEVTLSDTGGCSTQQIIDVMGLGNADIQYGLWEDSLLDWVESVDAMAPAQ
ncbi:MAG: thrombospondin type 3 repeat-containing protein [Granulosicoccus sp.]